MARYGGIFRPYDHTDIAPDDALEKACDEFGVDYESYIEGTNEKLDARAHEIAREAEIR